MSRAVADRIAEALLYEGYILYPYRPAVKNRRRLTFGGLYPRAYSEAQSGADLWEMQAQCLVQARPGATVRVRVRFLHLVTRTAGQLARPIRDLPRHGEPAYRPVEVLETGGQRYCTWQEAVEREIALGERDLAALGQEPLRREFWFAPRRSVEGVRGPDGDVVGVLVREAQPVEGAVELSTEAAGEGLVRVTVRVRNQTRPAATRPTTREEALPHTLISTHVILGAREAEFVSLLDPPEHGRAAAAGCRNVGCWPVLVGEKGQKDTMLASPVILYDYPQIAPEGTGDLSGGTEIDESLTLRILSLTDEEKRAAAAVDPRARALLERTEALTREQLPPGERIPGA